MNYGVLRYVVRESLMRFLNRRSLRGENLSIGLYDYNKYESSFVWF